MSRYEAPLVRYATHITRDIERARDVVQDTFLTWIRTQGDGAGANSPHDGAKLKAWLFTVCRNRAVDVVRKERGMSHMSDESKRVVSPAPSPRDRAEHREACEKVMTILETLPEKYREVLRLKYQNDFTYREIAEITGHSISHVGVIIHTGIDRLRTSFRRIGLQDPPARRTRHEVQDETRT